MSFKSIRINHISSYVFRTTLTKTDIFLKVSHSHKSPPKWTIVLTHNRMTLLKKDVFEEVVRFRKVAYFLIERMPFGETDVRSNDFHFLKRHPLI